MASPRFYVTAQVEHELRFKEFGRLVEMRINKALVEGAAILLNAVRENETRVGEPRAGGKLPGVHVPDGVHLRDSFQARFVQGLGGIMGLGNSRIVVYTANPNAIWQELGTRSRRRKAYKPSSKTRNNEFPFRAVEGDGGVAPLYFMRRALKQTGPEIEAMIIRAIGSAGEFGGGSTLVDTTSLHSPARSTHYPVSSRPW